MRSILLVSLIVLSLIAPLALTTLEAYAAATSSLDNAINEGINYVLRSVAFLDNSYSKAVIRDHPSIPIAIEWNGKQIIAGGVLDPGNKEYMEESDIGPNYVFERYYFNPDDDNEYEIIIEVKVQNIDETTDQVSIHVVKCTLNNVRMIVGSYSPVINTYIYSGWSKTMNVPYYYTWHYSARYVARHSTRIAAWLLEEFGYDEYAQALNNFMNSLGFKYDVYAPVFGKDVSYPDDFFDHKQDTWLGNGYDAHPWYFDSSRVLYPYKSRMYIFDAASIFDIALRGWKEAPLYHLLRALHLMNKYGTAKLSEIEKEIKTAMDEGALDNYGLHRAEIDIGYVLTGIPSGKIYKYYYKGYPVYLNAVFLDTLVAYYKLTGNRYLNGIDILQLADRLAGLLIKAQWIYEHETPWGTIRLALYRGGWAAAYEPGSVKVEGSAWGIIDTATAGLDAAAGILAGIGVNLPQSLLPMPSEFPTIVNSESTILAIKALKDYKSLGRAPEIPTIIRPYHGEFYYGNGYGDGQGTTSTDGKTIKATISVLDFINTHYHYQYANYKLLINETSSVITFEYDIYGLLSYRAWSLDAGSYKISIFVKIWDPSGNKIEDHEYVISQGYLAQSSTSNFTTIHIRPSYCIIAEPGEYTIQIGLYIAGKGWIDIDAGSDGSGNGLIIDQLNIYIYQ